MYPFKLQFHDLRSERGIAEKTEKKRRNDPNAGDKVYIFYFLETLFGSWNTKKVLLYLKETVFSFSAQISNFQIVLMTYLEKFMGFWEGGFFVC